jgi:hypothetical protein
MHSEIKPAVRSDDGFRTPEDEAADYVTWEVENTDRQNIFYLHGALHLFDAEHELKKYTWVNTGIRLIEQIRTALQANLYPLIVAEGQSQEKMAKLLHSMYLSRGYRSFAKIGHTSSSMDCLLVRTTSIGLILFDLIRKGQTRTLYVSLFGDPDSETNRLIRTRAVQISVEWGERRPLEVHFYDAASANGWG